MEEVFADGRNIGCMLYLCLNKFPMLILRKKGKGKTLLSCYCLAVINSPTFAFKVIHEQDAFIKEKQVLELVCPPFYKDSISFQEKMLSVEVFKILRVYLNTNIYITNLRRPKACGG